MIMVILAGGVGTRLWPLSSPSCPKYLLQLIGDKTMIQHTFSRAEKLTKTDKIFVVTDQNNKPKIEAQLPDLLSDHIVAIPADRGTATSIVMALDLINRQFSDKNETIAFIHADHAISDTNGFVRSFQIADQVTREHEEITLVGIDPTYPATGFGYIEKGKQTGRAFEVNSFKEKPDLATAEQYLASGRYVWNAGYFIGSLKTFLATINEYSPILKATWDKFSQIDKVLGDEYNEVFANEPSEQIDTALMEKAKRLLVVSAEFDWTDVGSFKDLHDILPRDARDNHIEGKNVYADRVKNVYIRNDESDTPVVVIGVDDIAVVNTPNGILIARHDCARNIGEIAKQINSKV